MQESFRMEDLCQVLIELEKRGSAHYLHLASLADTSTLKNLFETLSKEEQHHEVLYASLKKEWVHHETSEIDEGYVSYVKALLDTTFHTLAHVQKVSDLKEGIHLALMLEKDTIMLLNELKQILGQAESQKIEWIIEEEKKHIQTIVTLVQ